MEGLHNNQHSVINILKKSNKTPQKETIHSNLKGAEILEQSTQILVENSVSKKPLKEESENIGRSRKKGVLIPSKKVEWSDEFKYGLIQETLTQPKPIVEANRTLESIHRYLLKDQSEIVNKRYLSRLHSGVEYAIKRLKPPSTTFIQNSSQQLKESTNSKKKILFLDLDETIIKTKESGGTQKSGTNYRLLIRPYTLTFLEELSQFYQIHVFTAASKTYAQAVINRLNRDKVLINDMLTRDNCFQTKKGHFIKDLRIVKNRQLKDIVILDNTVQAFGLQLNNGVPILDFYGQEGDKELKKLIPFLKSLSQVKDVRPVIEKKFNLAGLLNIKKKDLDYYFEALWT